VPRNALLSQRQRTLVRDVVLPPGPQQAAVVSVLGAVLAAVLVRVPFVGLPGYPDEAGYLLVARHWHSGGPGLYGDLWVDRPPLLILFWRLADFMGGIEASRWLAMIAVAVLVASAGSAGWSISCLRGARWACATAAVFSASPLLDAQEVDGEILAIPLVMLSCALVLLASQPHHQPRRSPVYAALAGAAAASAFLVKQNFLEGLAFASVFIVFSFLRGGISRSFAGRLLRWGAVGTLVPIVLTLWWAATRSAGLGTLYYTLFGFRSDAAAVIGSHSLSGPDRRFSELATLFLLSGLLPLALNFLVAALPELRRRNPIPVAITAMLVIEGAGIGLGGSYWPHYLLQLVPSVALGAAWLAGRSRRRVPRVLIAFATASCLVATSSTFFAPGPGRAEAAVSRYLAQAHAIGDTGYVAYGHPNILESSGLRPTYPYMWSLGLRVLDPDLTKLTAQMRSNRAPTWFVQGGPVNSWHIDSLGTLRRTRDERYRLVATVCGVPVYLLRGVSRLNPGAPSTC